MYLIVILLKTSALGNLTRRSGERRLFRFFFLGLSTVNVIALEDLVGFGMVTGTSCNYLTSYWSNDKCLIFRTDSRTGKN